MRKALALAIFAPFLLIGAAYPDEDKPDPIDEAAYAEPAPAPAQATYRPCRPGPGDDRCIQLYERGVRAAYARWQREQDEDRAPTRLAMGGPVDDRAREPRRHRRSEARRCIEDDRHDGGHDHDSEAEDVPAAVPDDDEGYGGETRGM
jgi:hypothetical protein